MVNSQVRKLASCRNPSAPRTQASMVCWIRSSAPSFTLLRKKRYRESKCRSRSSLPAFRSPPRHASSSSTSLRTAETYHSDRSDGGILDRYMKPSLERAAVDPIDAALVRASVKRKLFDLDEPVTVGRFVIERRLGAGGMGVVFQAVDPDLGRKVAIKLLHPTGDETKLITEARALAKLRHANVVAVHDVATWQ